MIMVYYKRVICSQVEVAKVIDELREKYNRVNLYFYGSKKHGKYGLKEDMVLVIAHKDQHAESIEKGVG
jgi:hypothetical protein